MTDFLLWLEDTPLSVWIRESISIWAFPMILAYHTIGLSFLVGLNTAVDLRILGAAPKVPLGRLKTFFPLMWIGFWVNAVSGVLLLIAYPTKALTNPLFYVKLSCIAAALVLLRKIGAAVVRNPSFDLGPLPPFARRLAVASLACWAATIFAGRFLAYTYNYLTAYEMANFGQ